VTLSHFPRESNHSRTKKQSRGNGILEGCTGLYLLHSHEDTRMMKYASSLSRAFSSKIYG